MSGPTSSVERRPRSSSIRAALSGHSFLPDSAPIPRRRDDRRLSSSPLKSPMPTSLQTARRNQLPKHGFVSDDQLAIGRETFRKFIDARDQSQLRMDQMDEFWEDLCEAEGFLNDALKSETELITTFASMMTSQYGSDPSTPIDFQKILKTYRAWSQQAFDLLHAKCMVLELSSSLSRTDRDTLLKFIKTLEERKAGIPSLQSLVDQGMKAYDGQTEVTIVVEDSAEARIKLVSEIRSMLTQSIFSLPFSHETLEAVAGSNLNKEWKGIIGATDTIAGLQDCSACAAHLNSILKHASQVIIDSRKDIDNLKSLEEEKEIREFYQNQVATLTETLQKTEQELYDATYNNRSSEWESLVVQNQKTTSELAKTQEECRVLRIENSKFKFVVKEDQIKDQKILKQGEDILRLTSQVQFHQESQIEREKEVAEAMGRMREELDLLSKGKFEEVLKSRQARIDELEPNVREKANLIGLQAKELNNLRERTTKLVMSENLHKTSAFCMEEEIAALKEKVSRQEARVIALEDENLEEKKQHEMMRVMLEKAKSHEMLSTKVSNSTRALAERQGSTLQIKQQRIRKLKEELNEQQSLKITLKELQLELEKERKEMEKMKVEKERMEGEKVALQLRVKLLRASLEEEKERDEEDWMRRDQEREEEVTEKEKIRGEQEAFELGVDNLKMEVKELKRQLEDVKNERHGPESLQQELAEKEKALRERAEEIEELKGQVAEMEAEEERQDQALRTKLMQKEDEIRALEHKRQAADSTKEQGKEEEVKELKQKLKIKEEEVEELKGQLTEMEAEEERQYKEFQEKLAKKEKELKETQNERSEKEKLLEAKEDEVEELKGQVMQLEIEEHKMHEQSVVLREKISDLEKETERFADLIERQKSSFQEAMEKGKQEAEAVIERIQLEVDKERAKLQEVETEKLELEKINEESQQTNKELEQFQQKYEKEVFELRNRLQSIESEERVAHEKQLERLRAEYEKEAENTKQKFEQGSQNQRMTFEAELETLRQTLEEDARNKIESIKAEVIELKTRLEEAEQEKEKFYASSQAKLASYEAETQELKAKLSETEKALQTIEQEKARQEEDKKEEEGTRAMLIQEFQKNRAALESETEELRTKLEEAERRQKDTEEEKKIDASSKDRLASYEAEAQELKAKLSETEQALQVNERERARKEEDLRFELEKLIEKCMEQQKESEEARERFMHESQKQRAASVSETQELRTKLGEAKQRIDELEKEHAKAQQESQHKTSSSEAEVQELRNKLIEAQQQIRDTEKERGALEEELQILATKSEYEAQDLRSKLTDTQQEVCETEKERELLRQELQSLVTKSESEIQDYQSKLSDTSQHLLQLEQERTVLAQNSQDVARFEREARELRGMLSDSEKCQKDLEQRRQEKEQECSNLTLELEKAKTEFGQLRFTLESTYDAQRAELETKLNDEFNAKSAKNHEEFEVLKAKLESELQELENRHEVEYTKAREAYEAELREIKSHLNAAIARADENAKYESELENLRSQLEEAKQTSLLEREWKREQEKANQDFEVELGKLRLELGNLNDLLKAKEMEIQILVTDRNSTTKAKKELAQTLTSTNEELTNLRDEVKRLEDELDSAKKGIESVEEKATREKEQLQRKLKRAERENIEFNKAMEEKVAKLNESTERAKKDIEDRLSKAKLKLDIQSRQELDRLKETKDAEIDALEQERAKLETKLGEYEKEKERLSTDKSEVEAELRRIKQEVDQDSAREEKEAAKQELSRLQELIQQKDIEHRSREEALHRETVRAEEALKEHTEAVKQELSQEILRKKVEHNTREEALRKEKEIAEEALAKAQQKAADATTETASLKAELERVKKQLDAKILDLQKAQERIRQLQGGDKAIEKRQITFLNRSGWFWLASTLAVMPIAFSNFLPINRFLGK